MRRRIITGFSLLLISLPLCLFAACHNVVEPMTSEAIAKRIKPAGQVSMEEGAAMPASAAPVQLAANAGELRYKSTCAVCHDAGIAGAPKFRNETDWKPRMAQGLDGLLASAIKGKGGMPPRGTCMQCSDAELRKTIEHMLPKK